MESLVVTADEGKVYVESERARSRMEVTEVRMEGWDVVAMTDVIRGMSESKLAKNVSSET